MAMLETQELLLASLEELNSFPLRLIINLKKLANKRELKSLEDRFTELLPRSKDLLRVNWAR